MSSGPVSDADKNDHPARRASAEPSAATHAFDIVSADDFKSAFREHPGGVTVITADAGNGPVALTATSVSSVSADPPLLVFSVSVHSSSAPTLTTAETVVIHFIDDANLPLALLGATSGIDRFGNEALWTRLVTGEPVFHGVPRWIRARVVNRFEAGGSTVVIAHAVQVNIGDEPTGNGLVYVNREWHQLGSHSRIDR